MHPFTYVAPSSVDEAISVLNEHGDKARPLAGGTDILVQIRGGRYQLDAIVDVKSIPELVQVTHDSNGLEIGGGAACCQLYEDAGICAEYPGIIDAASMIGGIQIQSRAGLGGNLCNAAPSADGIGPLIVYGATANVAGPNGSRQVAVEDFCTGPGSTVLEAGEFLVSISVPKPSSGFGGAYERFIPRNEMDIAVAGVASGVQLDSSGQTFESSRIALASVGPTPILVGYEPQSGNYTDPLAGKPVNEESINAAGKMARDSASPINDMRGTIEQRRHLVDVLTRRTLNKAVERARATL